MKLYSKLAILAVAGCFMAACTEDDVYQSATSDVVEGFQNVSFTNTSASVELDPLDATEAVIEVLRTETAEAVDVTYEIIQNTDSVFIVGECHFAEGDSVAYIPVEFPEAKTGKPYTLQLQLTDPRFVTPYTTNNTVTLKVTRVKWNSLGTGTVAENNFLAIFGPGVGEAEFFQRDDDHTKFRIQKPFHNIMIEAQGGTFYPFYMFEGDIFSPAASEYLTFELIPTTEASGEKFKGTYEIKEEDMVYYDDVNTGFIHPNYAADVWLVHPRAFQDYQDPSTWVHNKVLSWQENSETNLPGQVQLAPFYYMNGIGGFNLADEDGMVIFTFPGYEEPKVVDVRQDVNWEEVFVGAFTSEQLGVSGTATLYEGTEITLTDNGADSIFLADFGKPYAIEGAYNEETVLFFCVDAEGNVRSPEFATEEGGTTKLQPLGFTAAGHEVYAKINEGQSSFTKSVITLNITFSNADESVVFGTANEVLSNITYSTVGTADYGYFSYWADMDEEGNYIPLWVNGMELQERDDKPGYYRLLNWGSTGSEFEFIIDYETNVASVPLQYFLKDETYGDLYMMSAAEAYGDPAYTSTFDPETNMVTLFMAYILTDGRGFEPGNDFIRLHIGEMPAAPAAARKKVTAEAKCVVSGKKATFKSSFNPWGNAKKVSRFERFGKPVWMEFAK